MDKRHEVFQILNGWLPKHGIAVIEERLRDGLWAHDKEKFSAAKAWVFVYKSRVWGRVLIKVAMFFAAIVAFAAGVVTVISFMQG